MSSFDGTATHKDDGSKSDAVRIVLAYLPPWWLLRLLRPMSSVAGMILPLDGLRE